MPCFCGSYVVQTKCTTTETDYLMICYFHLVQKTLFPCWTNSRWRFPVNFNTSVFKGNWDVDRWVQLLWKIKRRERPSVPHALSHISMDVKQMKVHQSLKYTAECFGVCHTQRRHSSEWHIFLEVAVQWVPQNKRT